VARMMVCVRCGSQGRPKTVTPGSFLMEIVLWLAIILPGLLYSIWRLSARKKACPVCGATDLVPPSSPKGAQILGELSANPSPVAVHPTPQSDGFEGYCQYRFDGKGRGRTGHIENGRLAMKGADPINLAALSESLETRLASDDPWESRTIKDVEVEDRDGQTWGVVDLDPSLRGFGVG